MREAINEVNRRREIQLKYNKEHNITPKSIEKTIRRRLVEKEEEKNSDYFWKLENKEVLLPDEKEVLIKKLRKEMREAADKFDFETAAILRDRIKSLITK